MAALASGMVAPARRWLRQVAMARAAVRPAEVSWPMTSKTARCRTSSATAYSKASPATS